jgi:hypothetical protein
MGQPGSVGSLLGQGGEEEARLSGELVWAQQSLLVLLVETLTLFVFSVVFYRYVAHRCAFVLSFVNTKVDAHCVQISHSRHGYA